MTALVIIIVLGVALALVPQFWIRSVLKRHSDERQEFPGTGGEFARHVLDEMKLDHVKVEETTLGDHYDPEAKVVRLSPDHFGRRSLAAVVVAAHEVGHAMQDATGYAPLSARTSIARQAHYIQKFGMVILMATPLVMLVVKSPHAILLELVLIVAMVASSVLMHVVTLPVEFDASFRRALPLLEVGRYINERDMASARNILRAAAYTYVAAAAMSLLDVTRWMRVLRT